MKILITEKQADRIFNDKIECKKCEHSWKKENDNQHPYLCHDCGWDQKKEKYDKESLFKFWKIKLSKDEVNEKWSNKYKKSINCNNPKGFSQKAHCQGRKKRNMKIIVSENQINLIRRVSEIERILEPTMDSVYEYMQGSQTFPLQYRDYDLFITNTVMKIAYGLANQSKLQGDEKVILRNQLQRYITNNYMSQIRDYFNDRLNNSKKNITESKYEKNSKLIYKMYNDDMDFNEISDLTGLSLEQIIFLLKDKKIHIDCDFAYKLVKMLFKTDLINKKHSFDDGTRDLEFKWDGWTGSVEFNHQDSDFELVGFATPYWDGECRTPVDGSYFEDKRHEDISYDDYDGLGLTTDYTPKSFESISELIDFLNNEYPKLLIKPIEEIIDYYKNKYM